MTISLTTSSQGTTCLSLYSGWGLGEIDKFIGISRAQSPRRRRDLRSRDKIEI